MKVYITRDEHDDFIWVWLKPKKGNWKPKKINDEYVTYVRHESMDELETYSYYSVEDFKKKFGFMIRAKTIKSVHLDDKKVNSEKFQA
jgi:hypothetical protein